MDTQEPLKKSILDDILEILKTSRPYCDDGNYHETTFAQINKLAHEALIKIERLRV